MAREQARQGTQKTSATPARGRGAAQGALALQRTAGNAAMAQLVARRGKGKKPPAPKTPTRPKSKGRGLTGAMSKWEPADLAARAREWEKEGRYNESVSIWEHLYDRRPDRGIALNIARAYREMKEQAHYDYWMKVHGGDIKDPPDDPSKAAPDMKDTHA